MTTLRELWAGGGQALGAWLTLPSDVSAEATARTGFDYVCADLQHGALDYQNAVGLFQAVLVGGSRPIARVPWNEPGVDRQGSRRWLRRGHRADGEQR